MREQTETAPAVEGNSSRAIASAGYVLFCLVFFWVVSGKAPRPDVLSKETHGALLPSRFEGVRVLKAVAGWTPDASGRPRRNASISGRELSIAGVRYAEGIGTHGPSVIEFDLRKKYRGFRGLVGIDDGAALHHALAVAVVRVDGEVRFESPPLRHGEPAVAFHVETVGARHLALEVREEGDWNWDPVDWVDLEFEK